MLSKVKKETLENMCEQLSLPIEFNGSHTSITNNSQRRHYSNRRKAYDYLYGIMRRSRNRLQNVTNIQ